MRAMMFLVSLLLTWLCSTTSVLGQMPYGESELATQYQHRWTDELEFAMLHQIMQAERSPHHSHTVFDTQQTADTTPLPRHPIDARQPHVFTPIPATTTTTQPPRITIPLADISLSTPNIAIPTPPPPSTTTDTDLRTAAFDVSAVFPFNKTVVRRVRAACSLGCNERIMDVVGEGRVSINSSRAVIRATVESKEQLHTAVLASSTTAAALHSLLVSASNQTATTAASVVSYLQSGELKGRVWQLHTTSMLVEPIYQYANGSQLTSGYRASLSFSLQATMANASTVLAGMLERGVTRIDSVGYEAAEKDTAKARQKAVKRAVIDALEQAATAVQGMQSSLRKVHREAAEEDEEADTDALESDTAARGGLQVVSMRVTGVTVPSAQVFYPSQTRIFGMSLASTSRLVVDESVMSIPIMAEEKVISATVAMRVRF